MLLKNHAAEWRPPVALLWLAGADRTRRQLHDSLESAPEHALPIEGHALGVHHVLHARVCHHFGVDAVTVLARVIENPCKHDDLVVLKLHALRKRRDLARLYVVADTFPVLKRAVFHPDLAGLLCDATIGIEVAKRHRHNESINVVRHWGLLCVVGLASSSRVRPGSGPRPDSQFKRAA